MLQTAQRLTKRERRKLRKQGVTLETGISIKQFAPITRNQERAFKEYANGKNLFLHGTAGTGKTFLALYHGLKDVIRQNYDKVILIRSAVPSRDIGFLPGDEEEKTAVFETPYYDICSELFQYEAAYDFLKKKGQVQFTTTSFIRGITFENAVIIIDECQNLNFQELNTVLTRIGDNCKVLICGDTKQSDLNERTGKKDLLKIIEVCKKMNHFSFIQMQPDDVVRSSFVKEFILTCEELGY